MTIRTIAALGALISPIAAQQFGPFQALPGDAQVGASAGNQHTPFIANGDGVSLMVWQDSQSSLVGTVFGQSAPGSSFVPNEDIHGMLVDADGMALLDSPRVPSISSARGPLGTAPSSWWCMRPRARHPRFIPRPSRA